MSQENVEIVRRFIDHYNETGEPLREMIDPDVTWVVDLDAFLAGTYRGPEGFTTILGRMEEVFGDVRVEVDDLVDAGDAVLMLGRFRVRGAQSGATGTQQIGLVLRLRRGRIAHFRSYLRWDEASTPWGCGSRRRRGKTWRHCSLSPARAVGHGGSVVAPAAVFGDRAG